MRTYAFIIFLALSLALLLGGCMNSNAKISTQPATAVVTETPSAATAATASSTPTSSISEIIIPPEASIPADDEAIEERGIFKNMKIETGEWIYYADSKRMFALKDNFECPIKRVKKDGSGDMDLGITGFMFHIIDKYVYVDKNLEFGDFGHWDTVRMDLDGANKKDMPYSNMNIKVYGDRIYFEAWNESVLYAADSACEQVKKYDIEVPDQRNIKKKLNNIGFVYMLNIHDVKDGWIYFSYDLLDTDGIPFFEGDYKVNLEGTKIEVTSPGTFNETQIGYYE